MFLKSVEVGVCEKLGNLRELRFAMHFTEIWGRIGKILRICVIFEGI